MGLRRHNYGKNNNNQINSKWPFKSPSWRSFNHFKGSLNNPFKGHLTHRFDVWFGVCNSSVEIPGARATGAEDGVVTDGDLTRVMCFPMTFWLFHSEDFPWWYCCPSDPANLAGCRRIEKPSWTRKTSKFPRWTPDVSGSDGPWVFHKTCERVRHVRSTCTQLFLGHWRCFFFPPRSLTWAGVSDGNVET